MVDAPLSALAEIAAETGTCIVWLHHERKAKGDFEGSIGSQAIRGAVYTTLKCERDDRVFTISTEQRHGEDLGETQISIEKGRIRKGSANSLGIAMAKTAQRKNKNA
jgi:hypothetical protein